MEQTVSFRERGRQQDNLQIMPLDPCMASYGISFLREFFLYGP